MISRDNDSPTLLNANTLELALKTILLKYADRLSDIPAGNRPRVVEDLAREITCQAIIYQSITDTVADEMEIDLSRPLEEQFAGGTK